MKIFDVHTHVWPDSVAHRVIEHLQHKSCMLPVYTDGTAADLRTKALAAGYTGWMNCPVVTRAGQAHSVNIHAAETNRWPSISMGGIHPDDTDIPGELQHIQDLGLYGLKLHPEYQECVPTEPRMEPIWSWCEEHQMPVITHAGPDVGFKPPYHSVSADFAEVKRRHPELILICAHMGGWLDWDNFERDLMGHDVYIDTSFAMGYLRTTPGRLERLIREHGVKHVLYGTDSPWQPLRESIDEILNMNFNDDEKADILFNNAAQIFHF